MIENDEMISLSKQSIVILALETWRLYSALDRARTQSLNLRYPVVKLKECLEKAGCSFLDLSGQTYDSGMAVDVVDTEEDPTLPFNIMSVKEMITPIILWRTTVIHQGQIIVRKGTGKEETST